MKWVFLILIVTLLLSGCSLIAPINENETIFKDYSVSDIPFVDANNREPNISNADYQYDFDTPVERGDYMIGTFNIQVFGQKKANNKFLMPVIDDIIDDYDIIAIQEVRDSTGTVIGKLNEIPDYDLRASPRLGRSSSKEQYIFLFSDRIVPGQSLTYPDLNDDFEREPYAMNFVVNGQDMLIIQVHIKPDDAEQEIRHLSDVVDWSEEEFGDINTYILGDLNADCRYFDSFDVLEEYQVLVGEDFDTTTGISDCAYDRILATEIDPKVISIGVDNLSDEVGSDKELLNAVSDHYPVYFIFDKVVPNQHSNSSEVDI